MAWFRRWIARLTYLARRGREWRDVEDEMRFHVEMEAAYLAGGGMEPREAERRARLAFGGVDRYREEVRGARGVLWFEQLLQDVGYAARTLGRARGFTVATLMVLGLGIGATIAAFGVVRSVLLSPLPFPEPDRLVRVWPASLERGVDQATFSVPDFRDWRERARTLEGMALYSNLPSPLVLTGDGPAEEITTTYVSGDFFGTLGVPAHIGRTLRPDEEQGANRRVVLGHAYWQRRFGADPSVVGQVLTLDQHPYEVVGVMPPNFNYPGPGTDAWAFLSVIPQNSIPHEERSVRFLWAVARLGPGVPLETARQDVGGIAGDLARELPESNQHLANATVLPLRDVMVEDVRSMLWLVLGAVALILVIACANVSGLLLARGGQRRGELAVRMSLGAGRGRVARQLLAESAILGVAGGVLGLALAWLGVTLVSGLGADLLPRSEEVGLDGGVLLFALALTLGTTAVVGVVPALRASDTEVGSVLSSGGRGSTGSRDSVRLRRVLVGAEVAVSVVLLVGAILLVRSFQELRSVDPGLDPDRAAGMTLTIALESYPTREEYMPLYRQMLEGIAAIPGVEAVGSIRRLPFRGGGESWGFSIPGIFEPPAGDAVSADAVHVGGDLFSALGVEVLNGRTFGRQDDANAPPRVVVNDVFARTYAPSTPLVGRSLLLNGQQAEIIGVVEDVHQRGLDIPPEPTLYIAMEQNPRIGMGIVARVAPGIAPGSVLAPMRAVVAGLDPDQPVTELSPLVALVDDSVSTPRVLSLLLSGFAALAALLASLGVYGVLATVVRQRRREVGLRMALGAGRGAVVGLVIRQGMAPAAMGIAIGLMTAATVSGVMESLLFGIATLDPAAYVAAAALVACLALLACGIPAAWASRLEPAHVLREE